jgi:hypothetical protein
MTNNNERLSASGNTLTLSQIEQKFDTEFAPETIWVVPSKENKETIKEIREFYRQYITQLLEQTSLENKPIPDNYINTDLPFEYWYPQAVSDQHKKIKEALK